MCKPSCGSHIFKSTCRHERLNLFLKWERQKPDLNSDGLNNKGPHLHFSVIPSLLDVASSGRGWWAEANVGHCNRHMPLSPINQFRYSWLITALTPHICLSPYPLMNLVCKNSSRFVPIGQPVQKEQILSIYSPSLH